MSALSEKNFFIYLHTQFKKNKFICSIIIGKNGTNGMNGVTTGFIALKNGIKTVCNRYGQKKNGMNGVITGFIKK